MASPSKLSIFDLFVLWIWRLSSRVSRRPTGESNARFLLNHLQLEGSYRLCCLPLLFHSLVTVEGGFPAYGVGSEIAANMVEGEAFDYLDAPIERVTGADIPTPYAKKMEDASFPDENVVVKAARRALYRS